MSNLLPAWDPDREAGAVLIERSADLGGWLLFRRPRTVITAHTLSDVLPALREVERQLALNNFAAGFVSYEAATAFDDALVTHEPGNLPLLWFGIYDPPEELRAPPALAARHAEAGPWLPSVSSAEYQNAVREIRRRIAAGDTYQVNYTYRLRSELRGSPWQLFTRLVRAQQARYNAFVNTGDHALCSASPELFFALRGSEITCRPMKGTIARGRTLAEDLRQRDRLQASEKDRAENVMIVDMVRNDLSRIAEPASVQVPALFEPERYYTLWQLTSTVSACTTAPIPEIFTALFPCASITGAPKVSTMRIIREVESALRGIYTGAIGYLAPGRRAQFNVAIRTVSVDLSSRRAEYGTGGGIVWDSTPESEQAESLTKSAVLFTARPAFDLLETLLYCPGSGFVLLERHLERLLSSAEYFGFSADGDSIRARLQAAAGGTERRIARVMLSESGALRIQWRPFDRRPRRWNVTLASGTVDSRNRFLYHKTTERDLYRRALEEHPGFDDVLLVNERGELTESTVANLVLRLDGALWTPPLDSGLLPGVLRAELLERGRIRERVLTPPDLRRAEAVYLVNSVRGWMPCRFVPPAAADSAGLQ